MLKIYVRKSVFGNGKKIVKDNFEKLKAEVISILRKKDSEEVKKALEYFEKDEHKYTHLEKSVDGGWIEKAGYGVGTVRIWKGKKYKKVAQGKWVRVFDKEDRGAKSSMTRLIHKAESCKTAEELYQFCMSNHALFQDANGVDLPIMDKLRAAIDEQSGKIERGEINTNNSADKNYIKNSRNKEHTITTNMGYKTTESELKQMFARKEEELKEDERRYNDFLKEKGENHKWTKGAKADVETDKKDLERWNKWLEAMKDGDIKESDFDADGNKKESVKETYWIKDKGNNRITSEDAKNKIKSNLSQIDAYNNLIENSDKADAIKWNSKKNQLEDDNKYLMDRLNPDDRKEMESEQEKHQNRSETKKDGDVKESELAETKENKSFSPDDAVYITQNVINSTPEGLKITLKDVEHRLEMAYEDRFIEKYKKEISNIKDSIDLLNKLANRDSLSDEEKENVIKQLETLKKQAEKSGNTSAKKQIKQKIPEIINTLKETESEKHQNRSEAMKGNQNAKKYGLNDNQIEYYGITDVVEDYHGIAIVKNENGYSYVTDGKVNDRPEDFTTLAKAKERANDHYEMTKNIEEAKKVDFKSIKPGKDVEFTGTYNGWNTYVKKSPDGSKSLVAKVKVSEMREPLEFTFEVKTKDRGWQYDTTYGNEDGLEWAVEHPEQMEKQLKDFFKRDVDKEWNKMDSDYVDTGVANIVKTTDASMDNKEPIAKATRVADGKVTIPNDPAVKNQMKQLIASRYTDYVGNTSYGDMLSEVYYDGENLVSTDAKVLKVIKIGKLDGIEPNKYVKIDISGKDNISINQMDKKVGQYPNYKRVIPNGNAQTFAIDNKLAKEKIEAMKRDGSILKKDGKIALEFDGDAIKLDGTVIGKTYGTKLVGNDYIAIQADYILNVLGKNGEETNFNASENPQKALTVTTNVSTDVIMPMVAEKPDYEQNRKDFKEKQEFESERNAEAEKVKSEQDSRRIKAETKKELIGNRPDGIDADEYSSMIDFADDYYVKLGYDNSGERAYGMIKRMVDNAINQINSKDYDFEEVLLNSDNKVSRKIFEMLTGERVGSNKQTAKKAWENWVGQEAVDAHNKKIADAEKAEKDRQAAEQKAKDDAEREQYHGFMDGKTPAGKGKAKDVLGKKANFNGKVMSWQELADQYIAEGGHARASTYVTNGGKEKPYYSISNKDGLGYEVPKTVYDYAMHISNGVKKSIANIIMLDEYEHDDFDEDFEDNDASQPDLFNSPAYKVSAALDSVFGC